MLGKRKHSLIRDSPECDLVRQVVAEQIDLEIALKKRLLVAAEARVEWAKVLRDLLSEERTAPGVDQSSFHDTAERVYEDIEDSCHIISSHKSRLLRPITSGKPPVVATIPIIEAPRTRKRISLSLNSSPSHNGPILYQDRTTGNTVKLTCVDCGRSDFPTIQGFLNHCRLAHSRIFGTHDECIEASGVLIDNEEKEAFRLAGVEIHISNATSIRAIFERAVGLKSKLIESDSNGNAAAVSTHLSRTLGVHALTPTLAPFLGKAIRKKQIHVFEEPGSIDIMSEDEEELRKNNLRRRRLDHNQDEDKVPLFMDVVSIMQQDGTMNTSCTSEELLDDGQSRFHVKRRVIIADRSLYLPEGKRLSGFPSHTHRWQLSIYTPSYGHDITTFLERFTLTCLTQPPVFSQPIIVYGSPFVACSTTDKPFLARLKLYWVGQQNHPLEVDHWVELDSSRLSRPVLGEEQMFDVELDRNTPFRDVQDTTINIVPWTGEGDYREISTKPIHDSSNPSYMPPEQDNIEQSADYQYMLRGLAVRFPMVSSDVTSLSAPLPYTPARSLTRLFNLPLGTRKALELSRARAIRQEFETMQKNLPETSGPKAKFSTADVFRWLWSNGLYPKPPSSAHLSTSAEKIEQSSSPQPQAPEIPKYCPVCGVNLQCHSAMTANHYRNMNCQCSAELERRRAPVMHVYTLIAPSSVPIPVWDPSQINFAHSSRNILSVAHPELLLFARRQTESLSLSCFPRFSLNSGPLELGDNPDEVAMTLSPYGILAVITKFVVRDIVNGAVQVARDMQRRTKVVGTESTSDHYSPSLLTPNHVLESFVIKDGRKEGLAKCFSRLGTLLQVDTTLSSENNNNTAT